MDTNLGAPPTQPDPTDVEGDVETTGSPEPSEDSEPLPDAAPETPDEEDVPHWTESIETETGTSITLGHIPRESCITIAIGKGNTYRMDSRDFYLAVDKLRKPDTKPPTAEAVTG